MKKLIKTLRLDLWNNQSPGETTVSFKEGDYNTGEVVITLLENGVERPVASTECLRVRFQKPDGTAVYHALPASTDGKVHVLMQGEMLTVPGLAKADIEMTQDDALLSSAVFYVQIPPRAVSDDAILSDPSYGVLSGMVADAEQAVIEAKQAVSSASQATQAAQVQADYARTQGNHAKTQGDYAKTQGARAETAATVANTSAQEARAAATNAQAMVDNYAGMAGPLYEGITLTGNTVETTAAAMPLKSCKLYGPLEAGEYTVNVHGRNYFNINAPHSVNPETATLTTLNGIVSIRTKATAAGYRDVAYPGTIQLVPGVEYTLSVSLAINGTGGNTQRGDIRIGKADGTLIKFLPGETVDGVYSKATTFTAPDDGQIKISLRYHNTAALDLPADIMVLWRDIMLNEGTAALPYEPYNGNAYTQTLIGGALVAGESLDVPGVMSINGYNVMTNSANTQMEAAFPASIPSVQEQIKQVETDVDHALSGLIKEYTLTPLNGVTGTVKLYVIGKLGILAGSVNQATIAGITIANLPPTALPAIAIRTNVTNFAANLEIDTWHAAWITLEAGSAEVRTLGMLSGNKTFNGQLDFNVVFPIK